MEQMTELSFHVTHPQLLPQKAWAVPTEHWLAPSHG